MQYERVSRIDCNRLLASISNKQYHVVIATQQLAPILSIQSDTEPEEMVVEWEERVWKLFKSLRFGLCQLFVNQITLQICCQMYWINVDWVKHDGVSGVVFNSDRILKKA
jgi:hypothetical protein